MDAQNALEVARQWAQNTYFDKSSRLEIQELIDKNDIKEITERFYKELEFGTGGLRAILGLGSNRISKYSVRKATQAMATCLLDSSAHNKELKAAVSFDSRKFSKEFAQEVCSVFAGNGIKAYLYKDLNPVCLLSWAVRELGAQAGVMITASHNPPDYNGYKAYWNDGAQVTPPYDSNIIENYSTIKDFHQIKHIDFEEGIKAGKIEYIGQKLEDAYYEMLLNTSMNLDLCKREGEKLKIVYTPIHGTGLNPCSRALRNLGLTNFSIVKKQAHPDSDFPTVTSPNPENPAAMKMAVDQMIDEKADLAFGTDPDTDRLGVVVNEDGRPIFLNGNQIGLLMLHYLLSQHKSQGTLPEKSYVVKTIVTSYLLDIVAESFDVKVENTLTGFKWICKKIKEYEEKFPKYKFLFATEESFGYMSHDNVRDKDGVNALALMAEVALFYKVQNKNLIQALDDIYIEFGFSHEELLCLDYFGKEGADKIKRIMEFYRHYDSKTFGDEKIDYLIDYRDQVITDSNQKQKALNFPIKSNVLGFVFESGNRLYLRPSGTEPKIKFYTMFSETEGDLVTKKEKAVGKTNNLIKHIQTTCEDI